MQKLQQHLPSLRTVSTLKPHPQNPRKHSKKQVHQISSSIKTFGFVGVIIVDADDCIVAGHARVEAAKALGIEELPVICVDHLRDEELLAYMIADNKLTENAEWDFVLLGEVFEMLDADDLNLDLAITGFDAPEIDFLLDQRICAHDENLPDEIPLALDPGLPVTCLGDLWLLGTHRLLCADATSPESYAALMNGKKAQFAFSDPPYNVRIDGHVSGTGRRHHDEFAMASGEMSDAEFVTFLETVMRLMAANSVNGSVHDICIDWRHIHDLLTAGRAVYSKLMNIAVWAKPNAGMGSLYRSQHELVAIFKNGRRKHINNVELGKHGRNRSNLWQYAGMNSFGADRDDLLNLHPTVKPLALVKDAILDCSNRGGIVLDPFVGSGTTVLAAEQTGRRAHALELEPKYVDITVRRWQAMTGQTAILAGTGRAFDEVGTERSEALAGNASVVGKQETHNGTQKRL